MPPAWAFVITTCCLTLSLIILSYSFLTLLARVIPLSFEHFPFLPLPLYSRIISPCSQLVGISSVVCILLKIFRMVFLTVLFPSMNISFGISSGPRLFFLFSFLMALFNSFSLNGSLPWLLVVVVFSVAWWTVSVMCWVQFAYSGVPGLAWYRFLKYSSTWFFVSSGHVRTLSSSVIML